MTEKLCRRFEKKAERKSCALFCIAILTLVERNGGDDGNSCMNLHGCTVHFDNIKYFICPTNAYTNYSKIVEILKTF